MSKPTKLQFRAIPQSIGHWVAQEGASTYFVGTTVGGFIVRWERPTDNGMKSEVIPNDRDRPFASPGSAMDACDLHHQAQSMTTRTDSMSIAREHRRP